MISDEFNKSLFRTPDEVFLASVSTLAPDQSNPSNTLAKDTLEHAHRSFEHYQQKAQLDKTFDASAQNDSEPEYDDDIAIVEKKHYVNPSSAMAVAFLDNIVIFDSIAKLELVAGKNITSLDELLDTISGNKRLMAVYLMSSLMLVTIGVCVTLGLCFCGCFQGCILCGCCCSCCCSCCHRCRLVLYLYINCYLHHSSTNDNGKLGLMCRNAKFQ